MENIIEALTGHKIHWWFLVHIEVWIKYFHTELSIWLRGFWLWAEWVYKNSEILCSTMQRDGWVWSFASVGLLRSWSTMIFGAHNHET